jgi:predicted Zn-dependent peptidase
MYNDLPQRKVHHILMEVMYGDQPAGWSIAGTKENIDAMKVSDLLSNRDKFYVSNNTLVVVAGGIFDHLSAENEVEQIFSSIRTGSLSQKHQVSEEQSVPSVKMEDKDTDQVHFSVGFRTFNVFDKRNPILKSLISILDGGMSARLFHRLREELGICYYVRADLESFADYGFCTISAGVNTERFIEALMAVKDELVKLKKETVTELELSKAKNHLSGNIFLGLEGSDSVAEFFGFQEIMKDEMKTPQDIVAEIDCVLPSDVYNLANVIFTSSNSNLAVIGRVGEEDKKRAHEILLSLD